MNLHQLRIFLAVARLKSFTGAAAKRRVSQPDISPYIRNAIAAKSDLFIDVAKAQVSGTMRPSGEPWAEPKGDAGIARLGDRLSG